MAHNSQVDCTQDAMEAPIQPVVAISPDPTPIRLRATELARNLAWVPGQRDSRPLRRRSTALARSFKRLIASLPKQLQKLEEFRWLNENVRLIENELDDTCEAFQSVRNLPYVRTVDGSVVPRILAIAYGYLGAVSFDFSAITFSTYLQAFQEVTVLDWVELRTLVPTLKLALLDELIKRTARVAVRKPGTHEIEIVGRSLQSAVHSSWRDILEPLTCFDRVLRDDPTEVYSRMDFESRDLYRKKLANIAAHSDCTEMEIANTALKLAREAGDEAESDPRARLRHSHIGYYLVAGGTKVLEQKVGFRPPFLQRLHGFVRSRPDELYLSGIAALTFAIVTIIVVALTEPGSSLGLVLLATLATLVPSSQSAIQIINFLVTFILPTEILPKMDHAAGIPKDCVTLVAIPTVLFNEKQVHKLVDDLEVRFLGNQDTNLHFALLTDLPDSPESPKEESPLIDLCSFLIRKLDDKYAPQNTGRFFLLHRHRIYNPREQLWMGWERKRGKLMDLNNLLSGQGDSFPTKSGDLSLLSSVRYVITLDSDTELPRGTAQRLVGALNHPLNQAIVDPEKGIVTEGYGILQPRAGISVGSSARSRLASIYSGQTGFDIYTRAVSDVYQDLYGEGSFVGKGIYEVGTVHSVLDRRFPRNALLSHDLVEGAYARAGLVSDIEIIEDYPSHYTAYNRRKHRWLRGDWQITEWLAATVPDESGRRVSNPISVISQWKILDNLRRSLVEPALFILLVLGWLCLPGSPLAWTLAALAVLFLPAGIQVLVQFAHAAFVRKPGFASDALNGFFDAIVADLLTLTFLAHQALLSMDAVIRTMVRRWITRQRLLQWETAAQAEFAGSKRTVLDTYLDCTPLLSFGLGLLVWFVRRPAVPAALPILLLWAISKPISHWLNRPSRPSRVQVPPNDLEFIRRQALPIWRYFTEFSNDENHWLIPDNAQDSPIRLAPRVSPTNLGLLLNARQVACQFGYLTTAEFVDQTLRTFETVSQMEKYRGHLLNWYDTTTLVPIKPAVVSSVDSGNFAASLWTLEEGCHDLATCPLFPIELANGFTDYIAALSDLGAISSRRVAAVHKRLKAPDWLQYLLAGASGEFERTQKVNKKHRADAEWLTREGIKRIEAIQKSVTSYAPWLLPRFASLKDYPAVNLPGPEQTVLMNLPALIAQLSAALEAIVQAGGSAEADLCNELLLVLPDARSQVISLLADLRKISDQASAMVTEMDFSFLLNRGRRLLSIGYDTDRNELLPACYDLLASEARIATFIAIAKDNIPQETWFTLGRGHALEKGRAVLLSWSGTMFEYLMPAIWTYVYPNTLLERAAIAAVRVQRDYVEDRGIPWGISESSYAQKDDSGNYHYLAFGVAKLAISKIDELEPVISPYSSFLALHVEVPGALRNLRRMQAKKWIGSYGFYESIDFNPARRTSWFHRHEIVHCWMAHHLGMSLLSIANLLDDDLVRKWFHSHPRVQATELLLQERPASHFRPVRRNYNRSKAA